MYKPNSKSRVCLNTYKKNSVYLIIDDIFELLYERPMKNVVLNFQTEK